MPKPKKPKVKKPKYNKKIADTLFSVIIRSAGKCFRCGNTYNLQCAHIFSRGYYTIRWSFDNAVCLCSGCHIYFTYKPLEWEDFIKSKFGEAKWMDLRKRALTYQKIDYKAIVENLQGQQKLV